jgi:hypothetical protein
MMKLSLNLVKVPAKYNNEQIEYYLPYESSYLLMNEWIGKEVHIKWEGRINCIDCGKITKKSFGQGFCYTCFMAGTNNAPCIINPELCEGHLGKGRDVEWEIQHHVQPHIVYFANSGGLKVGVTRETQIPTRWIDQGADETIIFARTPHRRLAGEIEVFLKDFMADKTNWRLMLKNIKNEDIDLVAEKERMADELPPAFQEFYIEDNSIMNLKFPVIKNIEKVNSKGLEKAPEIMGTLVGIKAQYLIFKSGDVFNMRSHQGYFCDININ